MDDWGTPKAFFEWLTNKYDIVCDLAATKENKLCKKFISPEKNSLISDWGKYVKGDGQFGFCNPPYSEVAKFLYKAHMECHENLVPSIFLVAARPGTNYWRNHVHGVAHVKFIIGRLKFEGAKDFAPFESAILEYNPNRIGGYSFVELPSMVRGGKR